METVVTYRPLERTTASAHMLQEIESWAPQMGEHALFLHLLLHDSELKQCGLDLFYEWQNYVCSRKFDDLQMLSNLLYALKEYKVTILNRLAAGEWLGAVYPQFVDHILRELIYFENKVNGVGLSPAEEVKFWNTINSEHAGFASHLLDPSEVVLTDKADSTSKKIRAQPATDDISVIVMAIESGSKLLEFNLESYQAILNKQLKSIIHPTLLKHVIREGQMGNNILNQFVGGQQQALVTPDICETYP